MPATAPELRGVAVGCIADGTAVAVADWARAIADIAVAAKLSALGVTFAALPTSARPRDSARSEAESSAASVPREPAARSLSTSADAS